MKIREGARGGKKGNQDKSKEEDEPQPRIGAIWFLESQE